MELVKIENNDIQINSDFINKYRNFQKQVCLKGKTILLYPVQTCLRHEQGKYWQR